MDNIKVSLCFPVYNEEQTIARVLEETYLEMSGSGVSYEIVVCIDGSTDKSPEIVQTASTRIPKLRILKNDGHKGITYTFERLYGEARGQFVLLNSADRQWPASMIHPMLKLSEQFDIVIAARKQKHYSTTRKFVSWMFNAIPESLFGVRTYDAGAAKLLKKEIIERFPIISRSPFAEAERIIRAVRGGYTITEYPVETFPRTHGKQRGVSTHLVLDSARDVVKVWLSLRKN
jgi:glycosyltransferase involved in cell wall biosynthesis